jgi:tRNA threonylcarbamoyladenosine biosynthesis protein TsaE
MKETLIIRSENIEELAHKVLGILKEEETGKAKVILLDGDLGAGKTTFTKVLASVLGIEKEQVHSPTFILKKEYAAHHISFRRLIHIDAYRFTTKDEAKVLRIEEDLHDRDSVIAIEWPSKMNAPEGDVTLTFTVVDDETREVMIETYEAPHTMIDYSQPLKSQEPEENSPIKSKEKVVDIEIKLKPMSKEKKKMDFYARFGMDKQEVTHHEEE